MRTWTLILPAFVWLWLVKRAGGVSVKLGRSWVFGDWQARLGDTRFFVAYAKMEVPEDPRP